MSTTQTDVVRREPDEANAPALIPLVDVSEDETGITLLADLPGADRESLSIRVDGDTLTLEAPISLGEPPEMEAVYAEVRAGRWRRSGVRPACRRPRCGGAAARPGPPLRYRRAPTRRPGGER